MGFTKEDLFFLLMLMVISFLIGYLTSLLREKYDKTLKLENGIIVNKDDKQLSVFYSDDAIWGKDKVLHELKGLISDIAEHQAKNAGKLVTIAEARRGLPKEKQISPEDMEAAFIEALKELEIETSIVYRSCNSDCEVKESLIEKIQKLRKKYEK